MCHPMSNIWQELLRRIGIKQNIEDEKPIVQQLRAAGYHVESRGGVEGAIVANADFLGGFSLYVQGGKLRHSYAFLGIPPTPEGPQRPLLAKFLQKTGMLAPIFKSYTLTADESLPTGPVNVRFEFNADAPTQGTGGATKLLINGRTVATGRLEHTVPGAFTAYACMDIGGDNEKPVSMTYKSPFPFTGEIKEVRFELGPKSTSEEAEHEKARQETRALAGVHG